MDEREMAAHVLEVVDQAAYRNSAHRVLSVRVEIGGRRHLDPLGIMRHFQQAARNTVASGARLVIEFLPVRRHCASCGADFLGDLRDVPCPQCRYPHTGAVSGEELRVVNIEVEPREPQA
ncbi:MAG TPA: hydrogenase maturation nickel metallochaperone HypA [Terriglobales bacterium]|nr:hydrogenase maturation nickel metallochaperone HypA [Terriglobales bacterium]